jgi:flagellar L-ring protein precursor FlgH
MDQPESQISPRARRSSAPRFSHLFIYLVSLALLLTCLPLSINAGVSIFGTKKSKQQQSHDPATSEIDRLLAMPAPTNDMSTASPGSTYSPAGSLSDLGADFRARHLGDVLTVVVSDSASAVVTGGTSQKRASSATASIPQLFGNRSPSSALSNLAGLNGNQQLAGTSSTSRTTTLSTTLSVRVVRVLPNGDLVVEGNKLISINSESQTVTLRGIVRQTDLGPTNSVGSGQVADLEVRINGRGVVNDAIRRPNVLYRFLLGILPF